MFIIVVCEYMNEYYCCTCVVVVYHTEQHVPLATSSGGTEREPGTGEVLSSERQYSVCVCVCVREKERERESVCVCVCVCVHLVVSQRCCVH